MKRFAFVLAAVALLVASEKKASAFCGISISGGFSGHLNIGFHHPCTGGCYGPTYGPAPMAAPMHYPMPYIEPLGGHAYAAPAPAYAAPAAPAPTAAAAAPQAGYGYYPASWGGYGGYAAPAYWYGN